MKNGQKKQKSTVPIEYLDIYRFRNSLIDYDTLAEAVKSAVKNKDDKEMRRSAFNFELCYFYITLTEEKKQALRDYYFPNMTISHKDHFINGKK